MQIYVAGILGLAGVVLIIAGLNGSWFELYGSLTHSPSQEGDRRSGGGSFGDDLVGRVVGGSGGAVTAGKVMSSGVGGRLGGQVGVAP